jgi:hypothetical protein
LDLNVCVTVTLPRYDGSRTYRYRWNRKLLRVIGVAIDARAGRAVLKLWG